jgi:hypothetical protein
MRALFILLRHAWRTMKTVRIAARRDEALRRNPADAEEHHQARTQTDEDGFSMRRTVRSENIVNQVHKQPSRRTPRLLE